MIGTCEHINMKRISVRPGRSHYIWWCTDCGALNQNGISSENDRVKIRWDPNPEKWKLPKSATMKLCKHDKVDDGGTCLVCRSCGAIGRLTSLRSQPLRLVWVRRDEAGQARLVGVEGVEGLEVEVSELDPVSEALAPMVLTEDGFDAFMRDCENPPEPSPELRKLLSRHRR